MTTAWHRPPHVPRYTTPSHRRRCSPRTSEAFSRPIATGTSSSRSSSTSAAGRAVFAGDVERLFRDGSSAGDLDAAEASVGEFGGDNRAGIEGTLHRISAIRNRRGKIVGLTCRVGRAVTGHVEMIEDMLTGNESILFLGRPGVGKTTVIREIARVLSDELSKRVVIIDTSNEIGGDGDIPHRAIGSASHAGARPGAAAPDHDRGCGEPHARGDHRRRDRHGGEAIACRTIAERRCPARGHRSRSAPGESHQEPHADGPRRRRVRDVGPRRARARCQKTIMERQAPPTFPILIEMHERSMWVAHNVEESVDEVLAGQTDGAGALQGPEQRPGSLQPHGVRHGRLPVQKNVAYTLVHGRLMGATTDLAEARSFGLAEEGMANTATSGWLVAD